MFGLGGDDVLGACGGHDAGGLFAGGFYFGFGVEDVEEVDAFALGDFAEEDVAEGFEDEADVFFGDAGLSGDGGDDVFAAVGCYFRHVCGILSVG